MRQTLLRFLAASGCVCILACSSAMAQSKLLLTNYTYSPAQPVVGQLRVPADPGALAQARLVGESAKLFTLDKQHRLAIRKSALSQNKQPWHDVVVAYGNRQDTLRVVRDEFIVNKVIAHRGAWKNTGATENSLAALKHAIALGCAGSEFDVHLSADGVPFVNHDPHIQGVSIDSATSAQLAQIKLGNGESLPTLEAYLKAGTNQNRTKLILEIKPSAVGKERSLALTERVVQLVHQYKAQAWVDYISFDYDILLKVQQLDPHANLAYLNGDKAPAELAKDGLFGFDYHYSILRKNENWIKEAHQHKLTVNAWTVNDDATMDWLLDRKVDFITTNEPEKLLQKVTFRAKVQ